MSTYKEYPDIEIPSILDNENWIDMSWHNDVCAHSECKQPLFNNLYMSVWVDYDNPDEREMQGNKYWIILADNDTGDIWEDYSFDTDDLMELQNEIDSILLWLKDHNKTG